jgi:hypothetical protein
MRLATYLKRRRESVPDFARRSGVRVHTLRRVLEGEGCTTRTAKLIVQASRRAMTWAGPRGEGGYVSLDDLPPHDLPKPARPPEFSP